VPGAPFKTQTSGELNNPSFSREIDGPNEFLIKIYVPKDRYRFLTFIMSGQEDRQIPRRKFIKYGIRIAAATALAGSTYYLASRYSTAQHAERSPAWSTVTDLPFGIADGTAAVSGNGFLVFGGYGRNVQDYRNSVLEFNGYGWNVKSSMPTPRWGAAATRYNEYVYVFGGYPNSVAERYEIENDKWNSLAEMPLPLQGQGLMAATVGSRIFLFFRNLTFEYDPGEDRYTPRANAPLARTWATCALVRVGDEDRIYIIGGNDLARGDGTNANFYYVPSTDSWSRPQPLAPYSAYGVTRDNPVWMNTIYYGFGHKNPDQFFKDMYAYDPAGAKWSKLPIGCHERDGVACAITAGVLYVVGGRNTPYDQYGLTYCERLIL
jgi:hypothetical protein